MNERAPAGLKTSGRKLWTELTSTFDLDAHRLVLLREACRTLDACDVLHGLVEGAEGVEKRRILAELRGQRALFGRLVDQVMPEDRPARRKPDPVDGKLAELRALHGRPGGRVDARQSPHPAFPGGAPDER
ncbi:hypothetical protein DQ238_01255 [Geodermatophilus sp. TF02-6]|uniref:hypothetical protein n=1 Tax=Geodermatophilus sp. TF02-6 TaxID=2250575 RepID=UPI000DEA366D|nr:hypothetical protein [Geodermatophilus sp. TF02-6]RBY83734.1 hypothetical protein DQ238_01255 [Geodermatophilus sp. TF02-6]